MENLPFVVLPSIDGRAVDLTLRGPRRTVTAVVTFTPAEALELQRQLSDALSRVSDHPAPRS